MATETIIMEMVKLGANRQVYSYKLSFFILSFIGVPREH